MIDTAGPSDTIAVRAAQHTGAGSPPRFSTTFTNLRTETSPFQWTGSVAQHENDIINRKKEKSVSNTEGERVQWGALL